MTGRYETKQAFRTALEQRLLNQARETGRPLDRLRKEVAHHRLLARLAEVASPGSWALKGGLALLARLDDLARATSDADANWRASLGELERTLDEAANLDVGDGFGFEIGQPQQIEGESDHGALRFSILALLAGREFERINFDVNLVHFDQRPTEEVQLRDLLGFAGIPAPTVPIIPIGQQLAEKLHAYIRRYGNGSSRPRDLYDMLVVAERLPMPPALSLVEMCRETFQIRETQWPPKIEAPPETWAAAWQEYVDVYDIPWTTLGTAAEALEGFWSAIAVDDPADAAWDPDRWKWQPI